MKKIIIPFLYLFCLHSFSIYAQSLDQILKSHSKAMGFEKLKEIETIVIIGENYMGDQTVPFKTMIQKPSKYYHELMFMRRKMIKVLDGEKAWSMSPMSGITNIYGTQLRLLKKNIEYGGLLFKREKKSLSIVLDGTELIDGDKVFKLMVTDQDSLRTDVFIDSKSYYIIKQTTKRVFQGDTISATVLFSNYKVIDGIAVAFTTKTISDKEISGDESRQMGGGIMEIKSITFNKPIDESIFIKPVIKPWK